MKPTREHREAVAMAYEGGELCVWERRFVEGDPQKPPNIEPTIASLERLAQLVAEREAAAYERALQNLLGMCLGDGIEFTDDEVAKLRAGVMPPCADQLPLPGVSA